MEEQLVNLRVKIAELESQALLYSSEKSHLSQTIVNRDNELEAARRKLFETEENSNRMIEQLKEQYEASFKQRIVKIFIRKL